MHFRSFEEFWPFYVNQHTKASTRRWHFCATGFATLFFIAAIVIRWWLLFFAPVFGYGLAWYSHFFIEGNTPASFGHPIWSFFLRLQDVCLDVDRSYGSRDKAVGKKAHATGFVTNFFSIEDFSVFVNKQHEICLCTCFHSEQIVDSAIRIRTCILLPSVVTVALPTCRKRLSSGSVLYV
ncbi:hypothetical protein M758_7G123800 [Ceratodon purpureus]|nr:hypothetical protein M758_7G123800 [Ceratodon purpureus]